MRAPETFVISVICLAMFVPGCGYGVQDADVAGTYSCEDSWYSYSYKLILNRDGTFDEIVKLRKGNFYRTSASYRNSGKWRFARTDDGPKVYLKKSMFTTTDWTAGPVQPSLSDWEFDYRYYSFRRDRGQLEWGRDSERVWIIEKE